MPSPIDEAAAALSRHKALEARAVRLAAGLPPDPPPPAPPTPPLEQPAASVPPQPAPIPPPATVSALKDAAAEQLESSKDAATDAATWEDIEILFLSDERVQIRNGTNRETRNYAEFGFADGQDRKPESGMGSLAGAG